MENFIFCTASSIKLDFQVSNKLIQEDKLSNMRWFIDYLTEPKLQWNIFSFFLSVAVLNQLLDFALKSPRATAFLRQLLEI